MPAAGTSSIAAQVPDSAGIAARVDHHYNALHSLRVQFTETYDGMGMHRAESGTMLLKKPGRMRWTYTDPAGKLFVLDGKYAWFYAPGDAQVQRLPASQLDDLRSPLRFLLGHTQLAKELSNLKVMPLDGGFSISGSPRGMEQRVNSITLSVTPEGAIRSMTIEETEGSRTSFTFSGEAPDALVTPGDFVFNPPANLPIVEGLPPV